MRRYPFAFLLFFILICGSCSTDSLFNDEYYPWKESTVRETIDSVAAIDRQGGWMYADNYTKLIYQEQKDTLYWVGKNGVKESADTLLNWLRTVEKEGLHTRTFYVDDLTADLESFRALKRDSCDTTYACQLMGRLEYRLTRAYLRYAFGQRYGYIRPRRALAADTVAHFGLKCELPTDSFCHVALSMIEDVDDMCDFLHEIQPKSALHETLSQEYLRVKDSGDTTRIRLCRVNLERSRWRYLRPEDVEGKYVWVNIPSYSLLAVDPEKDSTLEMRICCGKFDHQSPLLSSRISHLELNPYWVIPPKIIRDELAPSHTGDSSYFKRNAIVAIDRKTGQEYNAARLTSDQLISGKYTLRQDKGSGNSLGRLIFRFPNEYSVYLHDTNSPSAFDRRDRRVSHGCIRVQKPLDLAVFLMDDPTDLQIDKIRIAIDLEPLSEDGMKYKEEADSTSYIKSVGFRPRIPVFLDYYTLYPDLSGSLKTYPDVYGYDEKFLKTLYQLEPKSY